MSIGVFFCTSGGIISETIDPEAVRAEIENMDDVAFYEVCDHVGGDDGAGTFIPKIQDSGVERVVFAACSPRDYEPSFKKVMTDAGLNPYHMQMVNVREQIAWVTDDKDKAAAKAGSMIRAAVRRVATHDALEDGLLDMNEDVLIIGAGSAGLKAALTLAEAGRQVTIVEKSPIIGGKAVYFDEIFPNLECGPCILEPIEAELLHGPHSSKIDLLLMSEVTDVAGYFGNFIITIDKKARYVNVDNCIGCNDCVEVCPVEYDNHYNHGLGKRKAIDFALMGGLPLAPYIDMSQCVRPDGEPCTICLDSCVMDDCIILDDKPEQLERKVGTIIVAIGAEVYSLDDLPHLGLGRHPDIMTSYQFERLLATNGPTEGNLICADGKEPASVAIVHCAGSLDSDHCDYCSSICCQNAFKFNQLIHHKLHNIPITHFYKTIVTPGKEGANLCVKSTTASHTTMVRFANSTDLEVEQGEQSPTISWTDAEGQPGFGDFDIVILCPAIVPASDTGALASLLELSRDQRGFFAEKHGRTDAVVSNVRGVMLAGSCRDPGDISAAFVDGAAAAGQVLSTLRPGEQLSVMPEVAVVDQKACSGCKSCLNVCPYAAISLTAGTYPKAQVQAVLCTGCGTCVAACPADAIDALHFTNEQIYAEIEEALA